MASNESEEDVVENDGLVTNIICDNISRPTSFAGTVFYPQSSQGVPPAGPTELVPAANGPHEIAQIQDQQNIDVAGQNIVVEQPPQTGQAQDYVGHFAGIPYTQNQPINFVNRQVNVPQPPVLQHNQVPVGNFIGTPIVTQNQYQTFQTAEPQIAQVPPMIPMQGQWPPVHPNLMPLEQQYTVQPPIAPQFPIPSAQTVGYPNSTQNMYQTCNVAQPSGAPQVPILSAPAPNSFGAPNQLQNQYQMGGIPLQPGVMQGAPFTVAQPHSMGTSNMITNQYRTNYDSQPQGPSQGSTFLAPPHGNVGVSNLMQNQYQPVLGGPQPQSLPFPIPMMDVAEAAVIPNVTFQHPAQQQIPLPVPFEHPADVQNLFQAAQWVPQLRAPEFPMLPVQAHSRAGFSNSKQHQRQKSRSGQLSQQAQFSTPPRSRVPNRIQQSTNHSTPMFQMQTAGSSGVPNRSQNQYQPAAPPRVLNPLMSVNFHNENVQHMEDRRAHVSHNHSAYPVPDETSQSVKRFKAKENDRITGRSNQNPTRTVYNPAENARNTERSQTPQTHSVSPENNRPTTAQAVQNESVNAVQELHLQKSTDCTDSDSPSVNQNSSTYHDGDSAAEVNHDVPAPVETVVQEIQQIELQRPTENIISAPSVSVQTAENESSQLFQDDQVERSSDHINTISQITENSSSNSTRNHVPADEIDRNNEFDTTSLQNQNNEIEPKEETVHEIPVQEIHAPVLSDVTFQCDSPAPRQSAPTDQETALANQHISNNQLSQNGSTKSSKGDNTRTAAPQTKPVLPASKTEPSCNLQPEAGKVNIRSNATSRDDASPKKTVQDLNGKELRTVQVPSGKTRQDQYAPVKRAQTSDFKSLQGASAKKPNKTISQAAPIDSEKISETKPIEEAVVRRSFENSQQVINQSVNDPIKKSSKKSSVHDTTQVNQPVKNHLVQKEMPNEVKQTQNSQVEADSLHTKTDGQLDDSNVVCPAPVTDANMVSDSVKDAIGDLAVDDGSPKKLSARERQKLRYEENCNQKIQKKMEASKKRAQMKKEEEERKKIEAAEKVAQKMKEEEEQKKREAAERRGKLMKKENVSNFNPATQKQMDDFIKAQVKAAMPFVENFDRFLKYYKNVEANREKAIEAEKERAKEEKKKSRFGYEYLEYLETKMGAPPGASKELIQNTWDLLTALS